MNVKCGKLVVIEGTDGSGKKTQTNFLLNHLKKDGFKTISFSFPQYGKKSAGLVEEYLNGKYGPVEKVDPYAASLFYSVDRFDLSREIKKLIQKGYIVVLDRYVDSNAGHQGGKIKDPRKRKQFIKWLYETEYKKLGIPKPDLTVILHVSAKIGQELVAKKYKRAYLKKGTHDGHEANLKHLLNAEAAYLWLAKQSKTDHRVIKCIKNNQILNPEEIHKMVYKIVKNNLLSKKTR